MPSSEKHTYTPSSSSGVTTPVERSQSPSPPRYSSSHLQQQVHPDEIMSHTTTDDQYMEKGTVSEVRQNSYSHYETAVPLVSLGNSPAPVDCPKCNQRSLTQTAAMSGNTTHGWGLVTCCLTLCLCFIPYMMKSLKDVKHRCGNCGTELAIWHRSGHVEVLAHA